ncbi:MAG: hypothetical protein Ct9H300mP1_10300 [Planctomycetaceae bacterium]|nr:MAG: hypothetical protein Ct9H300mP1_10300 [Planctomycetaceae bacterium]
MKFIDAHSHIWTPGTKAYPLAAGYRRFSMDPPASPSPSCRAT